MDTIWMFFYLHKCCLEQVEYSCILIVFFIYF